MDYGIYRVDKVLTDALKGEGFKRVTFGSLSEKDLQKQSIYPLAHLTIVSDVQTRNVQTISYQIAILDIVDVNSDNPRDSKNDMSLTNNIEDIFHDLSFKWNKAWQKVAKNTINMVQLPDSITLNAGYAIGENHLAGYTIDIEVTIPNTGAC